MALGGAGSVFLLQVVILHIACHAVLGYVPVTPEMKSFSSVIKGGKIPANVEKTLYEHSTGQPGVVTEQWFTGAWGASINI